MGLESGLKRVLAQAKARVFANVQPLTQMQEWPEWREFAC